jgi:hypothetical protein
MMPALKIERCEQFYTDTGAKSAHRPQSPSASASLARREAKRGGELLLAMKS